ncbi:cytochrome P450 [Pseudonocardia eucalypti]|uniref:Cytochrome P450 n=1 Tax=Pseudonocardia eucalypti TaxID=648755 RepID=A0ABP9Q4M0_9PSEU|nr:cytochrome P450 [Pseudonocardia eucalypti]
MTTGVDFYPATAENKPDYSPIDVSSKAFWNQTSEERDQRFAQLRAQDPVSWQRPVEDAVVPDPNDPGYWALVRHAEIVEVSRDNKTYISGQGVQFDMLPPEGLEMSQSFLAMDAPKHTKLRRLISAAFTPRQVARIDEQIKTAAREVVDGFARDSGGEIDFVDRCAEPLPVRLFCDMFGVPTELRAATTKAAGDVVSWADPERLGNRPAAEVMLGACQELHGIAHQILAERRRNRTEDLFSNLVDAEVDGQKLSDAEIGAFFVLMSVAGTDTTKHTSSLTVKAMTDFPDQRDWLRADYDNRIGTAVEEFVRFGSPVMTFRRTAVRETELGGKRIMPGDKVVLFYPSGNRDPEVFADPDRFDLSRDPNPHVGFGGGGVHFCLGNGLAKSALRALFKELLTRIPDFEAGEPDLLGTNFMRGVKRLPFRFTPER